MEWLSNYWKRVVPLVSLVVALIGAGLGQIAARSVAEQAGGSGAVESIGVGNKFITERAFEFPSSSLDAPTTVASSGKVAMESPTQTSEVVPGGVVEGNVVDRMWETNAQQGWQVRTQPLTPQNWYITGVVQRGTATQVIVQFDGDPVPKFYKIGETLPGGSKLVWVRPDAIGVITPNRKKINVPVLSNSARREPVSSGLSR